jgi:hypothetical protein
VLPTPPIQQMGAGSRQQLPPVQALPSTCITLWPGTTDH